MPQLIIPSEQICSQHRGVKRASSAETQSELTTLMKRSAHDNAHEKYSSCEDTHLLKTCSHAWCLHHAFKSATRLSKRRTTLPVRHPSLVVTHRRALRHTMRVCVYVCVCH